MNNIDNLYEVSEIKNQFEKLQKKYQTHLPKVDPYLVYDLLLRQQKNPATMYMYNIEVFTRQATHANAATGSIAWTTDGAALAIKALDPLPCTRAATLLTPTGF